MALRFLISRQARSSFLLFLFGLLLIPRFAFAQGGPTVVVTDIEAKLQNATATVKNTAKNAFAQAIGAFLVNLMSFAANRLAYDAAVQIASGGPAEDPLYDGRPPEVFMKQYGAAVAGESIGLFQDSLVSLSDDNALAEALGDFNVCKPRLDVGLSISLGIKSAFDRPEPRCDINEVKTNWNGFIADLTMKGLSPEEKNQQVLRQVADVFNPQTNEFSIAMNLQSLTWSKSLQEAELQTIEQIKGSGIKGVQNFITGNVETPASFVEREYTFASEQAKEAPFQNLRGLLGDERLYMTLGVQAASTFTNTLLSSLTSKLFDGLFKNTPAFTDPFADIDAIARGDRSSARNQFRSFLAITPLQIDNYSLISEFAACPAQGRGIYNCVVDSSFASVLARAEAGTPMTVEEAVNDGLIDGNWPLIPSSDLARNQDPYCYTYGFCQGNLVKLRKARVLPIGWELAADSPYSSAESPVTLQEVMDGFTSCSPSGEFDDQHPWCKLIDPNWILKYPDTQCRAQVPGQLLLGPGTDERQDECVDMPSCISENDDGTCTGGYGYCVREENVWKFRGESCPQEFASCISFENQEKSVSYLQNTLDQGDCSEGNAGCLWYATKKVAAGEGFDWPTYPDVAAADASSTADEERIYFTSAVENCSDDEGGCRELIRRTSGLTLNLLYNASFEIDADTDEQPDGWRFEGDSSGALFLSEGGAVGSRAMSIDADADLVQEGVELQQERFYSLSFASKSSVTRSVEIEVFDERGQAFDLTGTSATCTLTTGVGLGTRNTAKLSSSIFDEGEFTRESCVFTTPALSSPATRLFAKVRLTTAGDATFDAVQIEQAEASANFAEGYSTTSVERLVAKVAPAYLGCLGEATDPEECANYAGVCREQEVGCMAYTPGNGDPTVTGITSALDACPAECVGYDTYKQEPTRYEPDGVFPLAFIPLSGQTCAASDVGCDEFTNISSEERGYFTDLRACVTEAQAEQNLSSDQAATFYTWEGSDIEGYQLKTWRLLESNIGLASYRHTVSGETDVDPGSAPCANFVATSAGLTCLDTEDENGDGAFDWDVASCDERADIFSNPDCREFYDEAGGIHYRKWSSTITVNDACATYRKTEIAGETPFEKAEICEDSGGYFDEASGSCRYFGYAEESLTCSEAANGCRAYTGGRSRNSRVILTDLFEDGSLTAWDAASAAGVTYSNESLASGGHSLSTSRPIATFLYDHGTECTNPDGCEGAGVSLGGSCSVEEGDRACGTIEGSLRPGKTYTLSFWAKGQGTIQAGFDLEARPSAPAVEIPFGDEMGLTTQWKKYDFVPVDIDIARYPSFGERTTLVFAPGSGSQVFIDNVVLREGEDMLTLIRDSWVTPASCDVSPTGVASPQYYLGCQDYSTNEGETVALRSFSSLCDENKVGCDAFYLTQESDVPQAQIFGALCTRDGAVSSPTSCYFVEGDSTSQFLCTIGVGETSCRFDLPSYIPPADLPDHLQYVASTEIVPADQDAFLVVNDDVLCSAGAAGCMEVGRPLWNQDRSATTGADTVYLLNDPDTYSSTLCSAGDLFCSEWQGNDGTRYYFKDPGDQTCEYRTDVTIAGTTYDGWFRKGTDTQCSPGYLIGGDFSGIWRNGDGGYDGWVGMCASEYNSCAEFQDPLDVNDRERYGVVDGASYFYLNNDSLDENVLPDAEQCDGQVSLREGCGLFLNPGDASRLYNTSATEIASRHADVFYAEGQFDLVDPMNCESAGGGVVQTPNGSVDLCASRCAYPAGDITDLSNPTAGGDLYGTSCYVAADCAALTSESGEKVAGSCASVGEDDRLRNDTNTVLKVNRDRQCSEWLSCYQYQTVWDERTQSFQTVCEDIERCEEYSGTGDSSFCSDWKESEPEVVLSNDEYTSRDISWYGNDYSGYAIPGMYPAETLTQANVAPPSNTCDMSAILDGYDPRGAFYSSLVLEEGSDCDDDLDCQVDQYRGSCRSADDDDFRLVLDAGTCVEDYGRSCTVGSCSLNGSACTSTDDCGFDGGICSVGSCIDVSSRSCASRSDCSEGEECLGSLCARTVNDTVDIADYSVRGIAVCTGSQFVESIQFKQGSCVRGSCLLAPDGSTFAADESEQQVCRGYPEATSPFSDEIVTGWRTPAGTEVSAASASWIDEPFSKRTGYDRVATCAGGEDCSCSYQKVEYGKGSTTKYFNLSSDQLDRAQGVCVSGGDNMEGTLCRVNSDCDGSDQRSNGSGLCALPTKIDRMLGLTGYCLERDSSVNINGDRAQGACLTWLPVDRLAGATDLYAKYTEAGVGLADQYMCAYVEVFADFYTSGSAEHDFDDQGGAASIELNACAETNGSQECKDGEGRLNCVQNASCPNGYYALMGQCLRTGDKDEHPSAGAHQCLGDGDVADNNDCPYVCVPYGSEHVDDSIACDDIDALEVALEEGGSAVDIRHAGQASFSYETGGRTYSFNNEVYTVTGYEDGFDRVRNYLHKCVLAGVREDAWGDLIYKQSQDGGWASPGVDGYYQLHLSAFPYPACAALAQVNDEEGNNAAWTDRVMNAARQFTVSGPASLQYVAATTRSPFGQVLPLADLETGTGTITGTPGPARVAACFDEGYQIVPPGGIESCIEADGEQAVSLFVQANPEARSFTTFALRNVSIYHPDDITINEVDSLSTVFSRINSLYAKFNDVFAWSSPIDDNEYLARYKGLKGKGDNKGTVEEVNDLLPEGWDAEVYDANNDVRGQGKPPVTYSLTINSCDGTQCEEEEENAFTLNNQNAGIVGASEFLRANLKFYMAAYKEQLPLRRVIIDWADRIEMVGGEGRPILSVSGSDTTDNYYKNHRGRQDGTTTTYCDSGTEWGMTTESCDPNFLSYNHVYTCSGELLRSAPTCADVDGDNVPDLVNGKLPQSPCVIDTGVGESSNLVCAFQPRVHIRDNWGWCSGTCNGAGCFEGQDDTLLNPQALGSECSYKLYTEPGAAIDPWVYFDGVVTVDP